MQQKFSVYRMLMPFIKDSHPVGHNNRKFNYYRK